MIEAFRAVHPDMGAGDLAGGQVVDAHLPVDAVIGRRSVFVFGHGFLVLSYAAAFSRFPVWPWNALVCVASLGAFSAASDGVLPSLAGGLLPANTRALGLAWVATAASAARFCSAIVFGWLWTRAGERFAVLTFSVALLAVVCGAASARTLETSVNG